MGVIFQTDFPKPHSFSHRDFLCKNAYKMTTVTPTFFTVLTQKFTTELASSNSLKGPLVWIGQHLNLQVTSLGNKDER